jgi:predicted RNA polymerase sigma factor
LLLRRGLAALQRARDIGGVLGPYVVQAEIAACHVRPETDWSRIAALYQVLAYLWPSPVVELNRAVAVGRASGAEPGLAITDALAAHGKLAGYPQLPAVRADLLTRLGRIDQARAEYDRAIGLTRNAAEAALFRRQRDALPGGDARSAEG